MRQLGFAAVAAAALGFMALTALVFGQFLFPGTFGPRILAHGDAGPLQVPLPTLGGLQFWADIRYQEGWRMQRNTVTGFYRLLDGDNIRRAWGTNQEVATAMDARAPPQPANAERHLVVLIHGALPGVHPAPVAG